MKFLIVLALFASAFAAPNYGSPDIRITSSYDAPALVRTAAFEPALVRSSYAEPALRVESAYGGYGAVRSFEHIPIVRQHLNDDNYGTYNLDVETGNGIRSSESGVLKNLGEGPVSVKSGSFSYISPEGIPINTNWVADEFGFRAQGAHLPVPPPIPAEIARSLHSSAYGAPALRLGGYSHEPVLLRSTY